MHRARLELSLGGQGHIVGKLVEKPVERGPIGELMITTGIDRSAFLRRDPAHQRAFEEIILKVFQCSGGMMDLGDPKTGLFSSLAG